MNYEYYLQMIRRSIERVNYNFKNTDVNISFFHIGQELRHIEAIIDEAYDMDNITYNAHRLLKKWYRKYYDNVVHKIIWL